MRKSSKAQGKIFLRSPFRTSTVTRVSLKLDSIEKTFSSPTGKGAGVKNLCLEIKKGEGFSLLGPSGCGKTTSLRIIGGFETPDRGKVFLNSQDITKLPPQKRPIRTVFQRYALFPHLNVWENVVFGLRMQNRPETEIKVRGEKIAELIEIRSLLSRPTSKLSGGEQQRVALARALITEPEILLLDEPFSALDLKLRERLQLELLALKRKLGTTFIFVTHDQTEAMLLSDRIAVMREGKIEQVDAPEVLYWKPINKFVASFIGQANFINFDDAESLSGAKQLLPDIGKYKEWMVRAERAKVIARNEAVPEGKIALAVRIIDQVFRGQERLYRLENKRGQQFMVTSSGKDAPSGHTGDPAWMYWSKEDTWVVDSSS